MSGIPAGPEWKPIAGFPGYEASHRGFVRSIDRKVGSRNLKGRVLKQRPSNQGYQQVDMTDENGKQQTRPVHWCVLTAHAGERPPGHEALHERDNQLDNRYPESLSWGPPWKNREQRQQNSPPAPKPAKECARCSEPFEGNGRRCHPCVKAIGKESARMLRSGVPLEDVAKRLDYPSVEGIHKLAVRYGGYGKPLLSRYVTGPLGTLSKRLPVQRRVSGEKNRNPAPKAPQKRACVPVSPGTNLGQKGQSLSQPVAERDRHEVSREAPKVTDSNHYPYPADLVAKRDERTRDGGTGRRRR
jgi:hypothetical protein